MVQIKFPTFNRKLQTKFQNVNREWRTLGSKIEAANDATSIHNVNREWRKTGWQTLAVNIAK